MRTARWRRMMPVILLATVATSCAIWPGKRKSGATVRTGADSIRVFVVNDNYYEARVHALFAGGGRRSLGTIAGNGGRAEVALSWEPRALTFDVQFVTEGTRYLSYPVDLSPGDSIELRLPQNIGASGAFRRVRD
jgi:hypothetical protein